MSRHRVSILPAVFTPMFDDGSVHYKQIEALYKRCVTSGFNGIFLNGTTGECMSLSVDERKQIADTWFASRMKDNRPDFRIFVHVGSNNMREATEMAEHAQAQGADGIAMVPTFYYRPNNVDELVEQCKYVASAAPEVPFYYYNIPSMTGVNLPLIAFLERAAREIPTFAGLKNSFNDLVDYQKCIHFAKNDYTLYWGSDEVFMMLYAGGNRNYVGSTYNFMGEIYFRMLDAFHDADFEKLNQLQAEATSIYNVLGDFNAMIAGKEIMQYVGVDCGPVRRPLKALTNEERAALRERLHRTTFFELHAIEKPVRVDGINGDGI